MSFFNPSRSATTVNTLPPSLMASKWHMTLKTQPECVQPQIRYPHHWWHQNDTWLSKPSQNVCDRKYITHIGAQWHSGTIAQPAIAPRQALTLDVNLGPSVQTHRTTGIFWKKGRTRSLQPLPITMNMFLASPPPWYHHHGNSHWSRAGRPWKVQQCHRHAAPHWSQAAALCQEHWCRRLEWSTEKMAESEGQVLKVSIALRPRSTVVSLRPEARRG